MLIVFSLYLNNGVREVPSLRLLCKRDNGRSPIMALGSTIASKNVRTMYFDNIHFTHVYFATGECKIKIIKLNFNIKMKLILTYM